MFFKKSFEKEVGVTKEKFDEIMELVITLYKESKSFPELARKVNKKLTSPTNGESMVAGFTIGKLMQHEIQLESGREAFAKFAKLVKILSK